MSVKKTNTNAQPDPYEHWSYRMISALCGCVLGIGIGSFCVLLVDVDSLPMIATLIGTSTVLGAVVAYRFPYAPDILDFLAAWLK